jgi:hypothetical protein
MVIVIVTGEGICACGRAQPRPSLVPRSALPRQQPRPSPMTAHRGWYQRGCSSSVGAVVAWVVAAAAYSKGGRRQGAGEGALARVRVWVRPGPTGVLCCLGRVGARLSAAPVAWGVGSAGGGCHLCWAADGGAKTDHAVVGQGRGTHRHHTHALANPACDDMRCMAQWGGPVRGSGKGVTPTSAPGEFRTQTKTPSFPPANAVGGAATPGDSPWDGVTTGAGPPPASSACTSLLVTPSMAYPPTASTSHTIEGAQDVTASSHTASTVSKRPEAASRGPKVASWAGTRTTQPGCSENSNWVSGQGAHAQGPRGGGGARDRTFHGARCAAKRLACTCRPLASGTASQAERAPTSAVPPLVPAGTSGP